MVIGLSTSATGIYLVYFVLKFTLILSTDTEALGITNDSEYPLQIGSRKQTKHESFVKPDISYISLKKKE